jgi:hypothetical protein
MDERLLYDLRQDAPAAFADALRQRLLAQRPAPAPGRTRWIAPRVAIGAAAAAALGALFMVSAIRASARAFLDLFRVTNFVAVEVDPARAIQLRELSLDPPHLLGRDVTVLMDPGPPTRVTSTEAAGAAAAIAVQVPSELPPGTVLGGIEVSGERMFRVTVSTSRMREVLDALAIRDVDVPEGIDGQFVTVRIPPVVGLRYDQGARSAELFESRAPVVEMPAGLDVSTLGEIALRILGLDPDDARELAGAIDWHSTLLVPIPPDATDVHRVRIGSATGLAVEGARDGTRQRRSVIVWSSAGRVFGLQGTMTAEAMLEMANAIR